MDGLIDCVLHPRPRCRLPWLSVAVFPEACSSVSGPCRAGLFCLLISVIGDAAAAAPMDV